MNSDQRRGLDLAADLLFFAPVGLAMEIGKQLPDLARQGRQGLDGPIKTAKVVGQMAATQGRRDMARHFGRPFSKTSDPTQASSEGSKSTTEPAAKSADAPSAQSASELPIDGYETMSASQVIRHLDQLDAQQLQEIRRYELAHRARKSVLEKIDNRLQSGSQ